MDGTDIGVFEEADQVRLRRLLERGDGGGLKPQIGLEILSDFSHQTLEGKLPYQQLSALLVLSNLTEGNGSGPEPEVSSLLPWQGQTSEPVRNLRC